MTSRGLLACFEVGRERTESREAPQGIPILKGTFLVRTEETSLWDVKRDMVFPLSK